MRKLIILLSINTLFAETDHLIFSKIVTRPTNSEMIVISNPTSEEVDMSNYFITDAVRSSNNSYYYNLPLEESYWSGLATDFIARFPDNYIIAPNDSVIIGLHTQSIFSSSYGYDADLNLFEDFRNAVGDSLSISFGLDFASQNMLGDSQEMLMLFYFNSLTDSLVKDVDYFLWGSASNAVDKTGISNYFNDTPVEEQIYIRAADEGEIYIRVSTSENGELSIGGNGISGHDETSENLESSWQILSALGCTDINATNYNSIATIDDGSCIISLAGIETGNYLGTSVKVQGLVVDYFDITVFNGPHAITIDDGSGGEAEVIIWPDQYIDEFDVLTNYPFGKYEVQFIGTISEYCDNDDGGSSSCESLPWECQSTDLNKLNNHNETLESSNRSLNDHCTWQIQVEDPSDVIFINTLETNYPNISIQELNSGFYHHQNVTLKGLIVDYFDITSYCGPHAITIADSTGYQTELVIFDQDFSDNLSCIIQSPFSRYEVLVKGYVGEYNNEIQIGLPGEYFNDGSKAIEVINIHGCMNINADNYDPEATLDDGTCAGPFFGCTDPDADNYDSTMIYDNGTCYGEHYGCTIESAPNYDQNSLNPCNVFGDFNDCCLSPFEEEISITDLMNDFSNEFDYFNNYVTVRGRIVDYFDITVYGGPHALTIEDDFGYRVEFSIWENQWNVTTNPRVYDYLEKLTSPPYNKYEIQAIAKVGQYDGELQLDVLNPSNFLIVQEYNYDGDFKPVNGACFDSYGKYLDIGKTACLSISDRKWIYTDEAKVIPMSYVIIPSIGETLDYSYTTPENSRVIVRLFDLSGRYVTTLVDRYDQESGFVVHSVQTASWDGRDKTGQLVSPGTYLIHIEAMNFKTGETTVDTAPVVVGVR